MALQIDPNKVQQLENKLQEFINMGLSLEDGLRQIHQGKDASTNRVRVLCSAASVGSLNATSEPMMFNSAELASAVLNTNPAFSPLKIAILTKQLYGNPKDVVNAVCGSFPEFTALEMGKLLLDEALYPNMSSDEMMQALQTDQFTESDIAQALKDIYGIPALPIEVNFYEPTIILTNASIQTGPGTVYNEYYKYSWKMLYHSISFIEIHFNHSKAEFSKVNLIMVHLTSMNGVHSGYSPIDILINGQVFKSKYDVVNGNYQKDCFDITPFVAEGNNTIRLNYCKEAITHYWIQNLKVEYVK